MITGLTGKHTQLTIQQPTILRLVVGSLIEVRMLRPFRQIHLDGRMEIDTQHIIALFHQRLHTDAPAAEHIVSLQYLRLVQKNICIGVQSIKTQVDMILVKNSLVCTECHLIDPVLLVHPLHLAFVQPNIRIVDESLTQQVCMHHTRHLGRIAVRETSFAKYPSLMQILSVLSGQLHGRCKQ